MSNVLKKIFTVGVVFSTILWSVGVAALLPSVASAVEICPSTLVAGAMIKVGTTPAIYVVDNNLKYRYFPDGDVFKSWNADDSYSKYYVNITEACLKSLSSPATAPYHVNFRAGSYLVKYQSLPSTLYVVGQNSTLTEISEAAAKALYGYDAKTKPAKVIGLSEWPYYTKSTSKITETKAVDGMLVKVDGKTYFIDGSTKREVTASGMTANRFKLAFVHTLTAAALVGLTDGATITAEVPALTDRLMSGGVVVTPTTGGNLTVSLASDTPAAKTIADGTTYNQMLKLNLTAGDKDVKVKGITVTRTGLISNTYVTGVSVWDKMGNRHGEVMTSISSDNKVVLGFGTDPIVVAKGTTETLTVSFNIDSLAASGTVGAKVVAATDVDTDGTVGGTFPVEGNLMTIVDGFTSISAVTANAQSPSGLSSEPSSSTTGNTEIGQTYEIAKVKFTETSGKNDIAVEKMTFYFEGTLKDKDLKNFTVYAQDNSVLGTTEWLSNRYVTVNFATPYVITKSMNRILTLKATVNDGSGNWFRVQVQNDYDLMVKDNALGYYLLPTDGSGAWSASTDGMGTSANGYFKMKSGSLVVNKNATSPSGNVSAGSTDVLLAKFDVKAVGEDVEIRKLGIKIATTVADNYSLSGNVTIKSGTDSLLTFSGDYTTALYSTGSQRTLSQYLYVKSGETKSIEVYGNIHTSATSADYAVSIGNMYGKRMSTLDYADNLPSSGYTDATGNTLTVQSTSLSFAKDTAMGSATKGTSAEHTIAQYVLRAGSAEGIKVTGLNLKFNYSSGAINVPSMLQNLKLYDGATELGTTISSVSTTTNTWNFTLSLAANESKVLTFKAYVNSTGSGAFTTDINSLTYIGASTGNTTTDTSTDPTGQTITVGAANVILSAVSDSSTVSKVLTPSNTASQLGKWKLEAQNEDVTLKKITFQVKDDTYANDITAGNFGTLYLYDSTNMTAPLASASYMPGTSNGYVQFTGFTLPITASGYKYLVLKGQVNGSGVMDVASMNVFTVKNDASTNLEIMSSSGTLLGTSAIDAVSGDNTTNAAFATSTYYLFHNAVPVIAKSSLGTALELSTQAPIFRYTITNQGDRDLRIVTTTINVSASGLTAATYSTGTIQTWGLWEANSSGGLLTQLAATSTCKLLGGVDGTVGLCDVNSATGSTLDIKFGNVEDDSYNNALTNFLVSPGESRTFILTADTTGVFSGKSSGSVSISAKLDGNTGYDSAFSDTDQENNWLDGVILYHYTPTAGSENTEAYSASDSYDVVGDTLTRSL